MKCRLHEPPWSWKQIEEHLRRYGIKNSFGRAWNVNRMKRLFRMWRDQKLVNVPPRLQTLREYEQKKAANGSAAIAGRAQP